MLCLLLSTTLAFRSTEAQQTIMTSIFVIMWIGSVVVWINANFLGSNMYFFIKNRSFFQSASLLGYCLFPLNVVSLLTCIIGSWIPAFIKLLLVIVSLVWSSYCNFSFKFSRNWFYWWNGASKEKKIGIISCQSFLSFLKLVCPNSLNFKYFKMIFIHRVTTKQYL